MGWLRNRDDESLTLRALHASDQLVEQGEWDEAVQCLSRANRKQQDLALETRMLELRQAAFEQLAAQATGQPWPRQAPSPFPEGTLIPEIKARDMTVDTVAAGIQHHGSIIVRGLLDRATAEDIRQGIDAAFDSRVAVNGDPDQPGEPWYVPFRPDGGSRKVSEMDRAYVSDAGGLFAVDSPRTLYLYLEALRGVGFEEFLHEYFGERPALSAKKSTLRRTEPDAVAGWHQDGSFLGDKTRSLNIWTAFTPCGVDAPGLDLFAERFDELVEMGGTDIFDWSVSDETANHYGMDKVVRPVFEPGDAILFDQLTLHRTAVDSAMDKRRYAIEMWFFAPTVFPLEQIPLYLLSSAPKGIVARMLRACRSVLAAR